MEENNKPIGYCISCDYYKKVFTVSGICRKNAPSVGNNGGAVWPPVYESDRCGEWYNNEYAFKSKGK